MNSSVQMDFCACIQCQVTKFRNQKAKMYEKISEDPSQFAADPS